MAELTADRFVELDALVDRYTRMMGTYTREDLHAAGFSDAEIDAYEYNRMAASGPRTLDVRGTEGQEVLPYDPTLREDLIYGLAERIGGDDYSRSDVRLAEDLVTTGEAVSPLGMVTGVEQGVRTGLAGYRSGDPVLMGLGALEAGLNVFPSSMLGGAAVGRAAREVDEEFKRQFSDFIDSYPESSGVPQRLVDMDARAYIPTADELSALRSSPGVVPETFFDNLAAANVLEGAGLPPSEVLNRTGVINLPVRDNSGQLVGVRQVTAVPHRDLSVFRDPQHPTPQFVPREQLQGANGIFRPSTEEILIADDLQSSPRLGQVLSHEVTHFDHFQAFPRDPSGSEVGSNPSYEGEVLRDDVNHLLRVSIDPRRPASDRRLAREELGRIRREETPYINYTNTPGEILARAFSGDDVSYRLPTVSQVLNPYLQFSDRAPAGQALRLALRPDLFVGPPARLQQGQTPTGIKETDEDNPGFIGKLLRSMQETLAEPPMAYGVPLDLSAGRVSRPDYVFDPR